MLSDRTTWHNGTGTRTKFTPKLVDMTCGAMARHMGRVVGWYTAVSAATNPALSPILLL